MREDKLPLAKMKNLGPASAMMLRKAGIHSPEQLQELGPIAAYLAVKQAGGNASLNLLWAIVGALEGKHWTEITPARKSQFLAKLEKIK